MTAHPYTDDLESLIATLPGPIQEGLRGMDAAELLEIVIDLGRPPQARLAGRAVELAPAPATHADLEHVIAAVGEFSGDNRAGIEGTLHRISAIRNRHGHIVGLTLRVGRAVFGTIDLIRDLIEDGRSVLLLGRPGIGKTTKLREIARVLADDFGKRVVVIDTSNEIAGDGDTPHGAIGAARRMQVAHPEAQHAVMIEAVENHMPEVVIVDEIGTQAEALAARTIAERGVQLVATAHGNTLDNVVRNPTLADLVGGVQTVTLGDEEARTRRSQKTVSERKAPPTFDSVVEIKGHDEVIVHLDTDAAVDRLLRGQPGEGVHRRPGHEQIETPPPVPAPAEKSAAPISIHDIRETVRIYPYAVSRDLLERVIRELRLNARVVARAERAHFVVALRSRADDGRLRRLMEARPLPVHTIKKNSTAQIKRLVVNLFNVVHGADEGEVDTAVRETEDGIRRALEQGVAVELAPRPAKVRRLQHRVATRHQVIAESVGSEPGRHLVIYPHAHAAAPHDEAL